MTDAIHWTPPGMALARTVARAVRSLQGDDPLRLVRVVTPDGATNDGLRRALPFAGGMCGAQIQGVLGVARELAAAEVGKRRMAPPVAVLAAVQQVLDGPSCPAALLDSRTHPATHDALVRAWSSLSGAFVLGPTRATQVLSSLAGRRVSAAAVVDAVVQVRKVLVDRGWLDQAELLRYASADASSTPQPPLVIVVTQQYNPAHVGFLQALVAAAPAWQVAAVAFDDPLLSTAAHVGRLCGLESPPPPLPPAPPPLSLPGQPSPVQNPVVVSCPDHDEEAREVARRIIRLLQAGTAADQIAVYYPPGGPHHTALGAMLSAAGIAVRGQVSPALKGTVAGQVLRLLLGVLTDGLHRSAAVELARVAPLGWYLDPHGVERASARNTSRWTRQCRSFGIVQEADWDYWAPPASPDERSPDSPPADPQPAARQPADHQPNADHQNHEQPNHEQPIDEPPEHGQLTLDLQSPGARPTTGPDTRASAHVADPSPPALDVSLWRFVRHQIRLRDAVRHASTWRQAATRLGHWWRVHAGTVEWRAAHWKGYPAWQFEAAEQVEALLAELAELDEVGLPWAPRTASRLLLAALDETVLTAESKGAGVLVAQVVDAVGGAFEHVFVVGANQGLLPGSTPDDLVLTAAHGPEPFGVLTGPANRPRRDQRGVVAAISGAGTAATVSFSRYDLRNGGELYPAGFLPPASDHQIIVSHAAQVLAAGDAWLDPAEWFAVGPARGHPRLQRRRRAITSRLQRLPGEYEGHVGDLRAAGRANPFVEASGDGPVRLRDIGVTALERMANCGLTYFVEDVLGARQPLADAEELTDIDGRERGTLVHQVLDSLTKEWLAEHPFAAGTQPWIADRLELEQRIRRATEIFDTLAADLLARRRVGHHEMWTARRTQLLGAIADLLAEELATVCPVHSEFVFGQGVDAPLVWSTAHGDIAFRGSIDRIQRIGDQVHVLDFKSSKRHKYAKISEDQPLGAAAEFLQLPLYAWAAEQILQQPVQSASYHFAATPRDRAPVAVSMSEHTRELLRERLDELVGQVLNGEFESSEVDDRFPCTVCCPDALGVDQINQRRRVWQAERARRELLAEAGDP